MDVEKPQDTKAYPGYGLLRAHFFKQDAEAAHLRAIKNLQRLFRFPPAVWLLQHYLTRGRRGLEQTLMGVDFPSPLGLAAGFDKDALLVRGIHSLGFGFVEVGTVTLRPQSGNDKPRLWRLPEEGGLINHMGFNNDGAAEVAARLKQLKHRHIPIGVNIGKNRETAVDDTLNELQEVLHIIYPFADYLVVNVSSPNTPGLRQLQRPEHLAPLLHGLLSYVKRLSIQFGVEVKPLLVKLAPELEGEELTSVLELIEQSEIAGVIVTNSLWTEKGGKSGLPLLSNTLARVRQLRQHLGENKTIIGVGGVFSPESAFSILQAGADLIQVYTGWVYRGPPLVPRVHLDLQRRFKQSGMPRFADYLKNLHQVGLQKTLVQQNK